MAGGGKRGEASSLLLVTLLVTLLAFFATNSSAARVTNPSAIPRQSGTECDGGTARWTVLHLRVSSHLPTFLVPLRRPPKVEPSQQWAIEETGGKLGTMV
ncbi:hypothetical protein OPV22_007036 [Ensete ventricosum]|uniref:Uncharacterized protein n=1 Tax=Ensete ventricosum TaxID=4639 RepID=A0AAV8RSF0_ENSVE|nr:hypothetical protein OPV22_007036 [Ensete ventricosum]